MKILQRYVLRELWLPFMVCLVTLNFIFMGGYLIKAAQFIVGRGVPLWDTVFVLLLALPAMIGYTVPTSILTAVLVVFGNLSQNNEIRAIKASGIHLIPIMAPVFLAGLGISFMMVVFNDQLATNADFVLRRTTKQLLIKHPNAMVEPGRFVKLTDDLVFLAKKLNGKEMKDIVAYENEGSDKPVRTIIAERGEFVTSADHSRMTIRLYDGSVSDAENSSVQSIQFKTYEFPTLGQEDVRKMQKKMRDLTLAELLMRLASPGNSKHDRREIWTAFHQRIAFSFGSFIFVFIGIPIAILVHRGEIVLSFGIAMAAASIYYILFVGAKTFSMQGILPAPISFWIPNVLLFVLGARLLKRSLAA